jgi:TetR/AcrR family transcriptional regulator, cholesterol catabolism regulator
MTMNEQLSRRERKKRETRQRLMEAALELFHEHGYDATTVEQIAEAADVAKGTFFNYFATKEAILPAIAARLLQQLEEMLSSERGAPASPVARIKLALRLMAEDPLCEAKLARRLFTAVMRRRDAHPGHALRNLLTEQVRQAQAAGEVRADLDPVYLGNVISALFFQQLMMWHHGYRPAPLPELLDATVDLLLDGIAGPNWRQSF